MFPSIVEARRTVQRKQPDTSFRSQIESTGRRSVQDRFFELGRCYYRGNVRDKRNSELLGQRPQASARTLSYAFGPFFFSPPALGESDSRYSVFPKTRIEQKSAHLPYKPSTDLLPSRKLVRPCSVAKPRRQPSPAYTPWRSDDARRNRRFLGARLEDSGMKKGGRREKFPAPARLYEGPERLSGILRTVVRAPRPRLRYGSSQGPPVRYPRTPPPRCGRGASGAPFQTRTL